MTGSSSSSSSHHSNGAKVQKSITNWHFDTGPALPGVWQLLTRFREGVALKARAPPLSRRDQVSHGRLVGTKTIVDYVQ